MIVDSHVHLLEAKNFDPAVWRENRISPPSDTPLEDLVGWLQSAGVEKAVVMGQDMSRVWNSECGEEYVFEAARRFPDFFIPFASVEPVDRSGKLNRKAIAHVKESLALGSRGILLTPPYGQYLSNDRRVYPIYELAVENNLVVQYHHSANISGPLVLAHLGYTPLVHLNDVLIDFPDLTAVVEHLAYPWTEELFALMASNRKVYADLALLYGQRTLTAWRLVMAKEYGVIDRILYGSDYFTRDLSARTDPGKDMKRWIGYIEKDVNEICRKSGWPELSAEEKNGILGANAARLYGIGKRQG